MRDCAAFRYSKYHRCDSEEDKSLCGVENERRWSIEFTHIHVIIMHEYALFTTAEPNAV